MKQIILSLFVLFSFTAICVAQNVDSQAISGAEQSASQDTLAIGMSESDRAIEAYNNGQYSRAIEILEKEKEEHLAKGEESGDLYYNLGNAYFRTNEVGKALLYYERALLLKPGDRNIRHNIDYANTKIEDKISAASTFFLSSWMQDMQDMMSSNSWAWLAVICFLLFIGCLFLFFFSKTALIKQITFYAGILLIVCIVLGNVFSYRQKRHVEQRDSAIIMAASVVVRSSPDHNSNEVFILHIGTKVKLTKEDRNWCEIEIADGNVGWIEKDRLEVI